MHNVSVDHFHDRTMIEAFFTHRRKGHQRHDTYQPNAEVCEEFGNAATAVHLLTFDILAVRVTFVLQPRLVRAHDASAASQVKLVARLETS